MVLIFSIVLFMSFIALINPRITLAVINLTIGRLQRIHWRSLEMKVLVLIVLVSVGISAAFARITHVFEEET